MKKILSVASAVCVLGLAGCSTTVQHVAKPDMTKPISKTESIIQLKSVPITFAGTTSQDVYANKVLIGELADGDEIIWQAKANSMECISTDIKLFLEIRAADTPLAYKCFYTKPQEKMLLTLDHGYPNSRAVRGRAFIPLYKNIDLPKDPKPVAISTIGISNKSDLTDDLKKMLEDAIKSQFGTKLIPLSSSSSKTIDLEILDYKKGNAGLRWLGGSHEGSTLAEVKVTLKEGNVVTDTFITRPVVSRGGGFSVGADAYIFEEVAEDIYLSLFGQPIIQQTADSK